MNKRISELTFNPIQTFEEALGDIREVAIYLQEENKKLREQIRKSYDEIRVEFKDELEGLQNELARSYMRFSPKEEEAYQKFIHKHYKLHNDGKYKNSSGITVHMTGTGVGTCYELECPICHEKENITDYDTW